MQNEMPLASISNSPEFSIRKGEETTYFAPAFSAHTRPWGISALQTALRDVIHAYYETPDLIKIPKFPPVPPPL
jgi:hypothetical protein